ncbi:MAG: DUF5320 domain-containing protein [Syntrophorhabdaceae bacterium]|nr:DUF5320 domain-containing protein [Syntrophorhabdaceae bacterium]
MPGGDRTGPYGTGPMTGRAAGFCAGLGFPGYANLAAGRGYRAWGRGRGGGGRGFRNVFYATGLTGWQRAAGYMPAGGNSFAYGGPYYGPTTATTRQELDALKAQAEYLEDALEGIRMQLKELEEKQAGVPAG